MASLYERLRGVFHPYNSTGAWALVAIIVWLLLAALCRKEFGGFFHSLKAIAVAAIIAGILWWIHPAFCIAAIVAAVLQAVRVIKGNWPYILIAFAIVVFAIWKYIL